VLCTQCNTFWPYAAGKKNCLTCNGMLRFTADDFLGDTDARFVDEVRKPQVMMAQVVDKAIAHEKHITAEAGTGIGKSFALLLPAILSGKRVVVSTATTLLQSQYVEKDLPFLAEELAEYGIRFKYAVAKGKAHYLCPREFSKYKLANKVPTEFGNWVSETHFGDKQELGDKCPDWFWKVCAEDCPGPKYCKDAKHCGFAAAKYLTGQADIIVANHALVGLNTRYGGMVLPDYNTLVLDEAHKAEDYFRNAFSSTLVEKRIPGLLDKIDRSNVMNLKDVRLTVRAGSGADQFHPAAVQAMRSLRQTNKGLFRAFTQLGKKSQSAFLAEDVAATVDVISL